MDEPNEDEDDSYDEEDMNEPADDRKGDQAERPKNYEDDSYCDKHDWLIKIDKLLPVG